MIRGSFYKIFLWNKVLKELLEQAYDQRSQVYQSTIKLDHMKPPSKAFCTSIQQ